MKKYRDQENINIYIMLFLPNQHWVLIKSFYSIFLEYEIFKSRLIVVNIFYYITIK